jgi:NADPH-dependent 2,4-dienoyl-CoA reductase/sulfur reductase-like enzyme
MSERALKFEIIVVGAGPGGLAAACSAAESGKRVALVDDTPWLGGQIWRGQQANPSVPQAREWIERFRRSGVTLLSRASVIASPRTGVLLADHPDGAREIHWQQLILATGARELFLPFPGWTLPGVVGPGGLQALVKNGWPINGKRVVVAGSGPLLLAVADGLKLHGAEIISLNEQSPWSRVMGFGFKLLAHPGKLLQGGQLKLRLLGVPHRCGVWPVRAEGDDQVRRVVLTDGARTWIEDCDALACGFGLVPNVELPLLLGCTLQSEFVRVDKWQTSSVPDTFCVGELTGIGGADCAIVEGRIAGYAATGERTKAEALFRKRASWHAFRIALAETFALRPELRSLATHDTLLCRCEDVTLGRVRQFSGWREAKLQTRCGMGACQGRVCGAAAKTILNWGMESVRLPVLPAQVQSLISTTNQN